jgi:bromodomain-containing protein 7
LQDSNAHVYNSELGMSLAKWVEVNIVDPLTQGRHSLIRQTALVLARGALPSTNATPPGPSQQSHPLQLSPNLPTDPRTGTIPTQILASLHFYPSLLLALSSLVHIKMQKIDMASLIKTPDELFVSEEEWAGKGIKERKTKANGAEDKMDVDGSAKTAAGVGADNNISRRAKAVKKEEEEDAAPTEISKPRITEYEMEGPEELGEVLDYVAGIIVELDKRNRVNGKGVLDSSESEDALTRNLRLNLLALAKRAPLDTIARLPMDLVPEHIRHFVPCRFLELLLLRSSLSPIILIQKVRWQREEVGETTSLEKLEDWRTHLGIRYILTSIPICRHEEDWEETTPSSHPSLSTQFLILPTTT